MTVQEGNILIGEFMGYVYHPEDYVVNGYNQTLVHSDRQSLLTNDPPHRGQDHWTAKWHKSWDELMQVVEKIESMKDPHHGYFPVHISGNNCSIQGTFLNRAIENLSKYGWVYFDDQYGHTKIEATWLAVINFIKWQNEELPVQQ